MTNKQAAETLRTIIAARRMHPTDNDQLEFAEAEERGADAIEMLEWLFGRGIPSLYIEWCCTYKSTFRAFCEAKWRESKDAV